jgi:branched-chain amino acid transport system substrate-binding protein
MLSGAVGRSRARIALALVAVTLGCGAGVSAQATGLIRVGVLLPLSGGDAAIGREADAGCALAWQEAGLEAAGRRVDLILEDTESLAGAALAKSRKLVERDKVHLLLAVVLSDAVYALASYVDTQAIPTVLPVDSADDLTQRRRSKWLVRIGSSASAAMHPFGEYAARTLGYTKVATVGLDDATGWATVGGFHRTFEEAGGRIIRKAWIPLDALDHAPYVSGIGRDADALFASAEGAAAVRFMRAYAQAGLAGAVPLLASGSFTDERVLPQLGDEAIGVVSAHHYSAALDTPANRRFRAVFEKAHHRPPSSYAEGCYTAVRLIADAVRAIAGRVEDRPALIGALRTAELADAPRGPIRMELDGSPVQNVYIRTVTRVGGRLENTILFTYPDVGQFWSFAPEEFLKRPAYSRDVPPCGHC